MRKTLVILTLVALIALAAAAPVLAANGPNDQPFFTLVGIVTDKGPDDLDPIFVQIYHGNRFAQPEIGNILEVQVTSNTVFRRWTPSGCVPDIPANVNPGDTISIHGMVVGGVFVGDRVTVDVPLDCCTP